jgi:hypothetical protein
MIKNMDRPPQKHFSRSSSPSSRGGQSLAELLIGMALGAIFIIGAVTIIAPSLKGDQRVFQIQSESSLANELLSNVKVWGEGNWNSVLGAATGTSNTYYINASSSPFTLAGLGSTTSTWSNSSTYRRIITINYGQVSSTLTNFPVLIAGTYAYLAASSSGGLIQNPNGYDITFTSDASGTTPLSYERETYVSSTGQVAFWIKIPSLSNTTNTLVYMFYDNSGVTTDHSNATGTWDSNFKAVWHLSGNASDSTSNADNGVWNGPPEGSSTYYAAGNIGQYAGYFNSSTDAVIATWPATFESSLSWTLSYWNNGVAQLGGQGVFGVGTTTDYSIWYTQTSTSCLQWGGTGTVCNAWPLLNDDYSWDQWAVTRSSSLFSIYKNGIIVATTTTATTTPSTYFMIGNGYIGDTYNHFIGGIDEFRLSSVNRSPSWIQTEYNTEGSPGTFYSIGTAANNTASTTNSSAIETVVVGNSTFYRYFYLSDAYRDSSGNLTSTTSYYDPSTKLVTAVVYPSGATATSTSAITLKMYITRNGSNILSQTSWAGGGGNSSSSSLVGNVYSNATSVSISASGSVQIATGSGPWAYRRSVTINFSQVSSTLTNFPVLIASTSYPFLAASSSGGTLQNPNGYDVKFTSDASGTVALNYERETYISSTGQVAFWVNIPSLSNTTNTLIYMFYDTATTTDSSKPTGTWNANFSAVWHLSGNASDSTSNADNGLWNGPAEGSSTYYAAGNIGQYAGYFNSSTDAVIATWPATYETTKTWTLSYWNKGPAQANTGPGIFGVGTTTNYSIWYTASSTSCLQWGGTGAVCNIWPLNNDGNAWDEWQVTRSSSLFSVYKNGVFVLSSSTISTTTPSTYLLIGTAYIGSTNNFVGSMDEFRLSNVTRSPGWIQTDYNTESSPSTFYTLGAQTAAGGGSSGTTTATLDSQAFDTQVSGGAQLNSYIWQGITPSSTVVKFQFAGSNSSAGPWNFLGPDGTVNTYFTGNAATPTDLIFTNSGFTPLNGYRYFKYRITLVSDSTGAFTPTVTGVTLNWSP